MDDISKRISEIEKEMSGPDFWQDKEKAQALIRELKILKEQAEDVKDGKPRMLRGKYDKGEAVLTLMAGAGGDDAEDWTAILFKMYSKFSEGRGWPIKILHRHDSEHKGIKNIAFEIKGRNAYGILKGEAGVHRLVRISPFSARKLRHTSFALLEVLPKFVEISEAKIDEADLRTDFSRSSGPGGQNVNKRETAVRLTHIPTGLTAHVDSERSQNQNRERALELLRSKLYNYHIHELQKEKESLQKGKKVEAEWGHQIRSYVFQPYKMVKDHRTGVETGNVDAVLEGNLDGFIKAEQNL